MTEHPEDCKTWTPGNNAPRCGFVLWSRFAVGHYNEMMNESGTRDCSGFPSGSAQCGAGVSQPCDGTWMT